MTKPVEITLPERTFICDENSQASVIFTISNILDENVELAASIDIDENAENSMQKDWFDIKVDSDWSLDSKATEQVTVDVNIPDSQPLGDYRFKLTVYSKDNPGDDFTTSEMICVKKQKIVVEEIKDGKFPWWMVAVAALLVVVVGVTWYILSDKPVDEEVILPDVTTMKLSSALQKLNNADLEVDIAKIKKQYNKNLAEETVISQLPSPATTQKVKKGSKIILTISTKTLIVAPVVLTVPQVKMYKALQYDNVRKRSLEKNK